MNSSKSFEANMNGYSCCFGNNSFIILATHISTSSIHYALYIPPIPATKYKGADCIPVSNEATFKTRVAIDK